MKHANYIIPKSSWSAICNAVANVATDHYIASLKDRVLNTLRYDGTTFPIIVKWAKEVAVADEKCWERFESAIESTCEGNCLWVGLGSKASQNVETTLRGLNVLSGHAVSAMSTVAGTVFGVVKNIPRIAAEELSDGRLLLHPEGAVPQQVYDILNREAFIAADDIEFHENSNFSLEVKTRYAMYPAARAVVEELAGM